MKCAVLLSVVIALPSMASFAEAGGSAGAEAGSSACPESSELSAAEHALILDRCEGWIDVVKEVCAPRPVSEETYLAEICRVICDTTKHCSLRKKALDIIGIYAVFSQNHYPIAILKEALFITPPSLLKKDPTCISYYAGCTLINVAFGRFLDLTNHEGGILSTNRINVCALRALSDAAREGVAEVHDAVCQLLHDAALKDGSYEAKKLLENLSLSWMYSWRTTKSNVETVKVLVEQAEGYFKLLPKEVRIKGPLSMRELLRKFPNGGAYPITSKEDATCLRFELSRKQCPYEAAQGTCLCSAPFRGSGVYLIEFTQAEEPALVCPGETK